MRLTADAFHAWEGKSITLLGMSGIGKTQCAEMLRRHSWFHYAVDYRVGTRYLDEPILDNIKRQAMAVPFLRELLRSDSIYIANNITVHNLAPVASFLGKIGNPERGGLPLREFQWRQALFKDAQVAAMQDIPDFIRKARHVYGYRHFVNDAGGSLCDLDRPDVIDLLADHTLILYIKATHEDKQDLLRRSQEKPRPLYYRPDFLFEQLDEYMRVHGIPFVALIDPDDFARWMFPRLFEARLPRYERLAREYGYTVTTEALARVQTEDDFLQLVEATISAQTG